MEPFTPAELSLLATAAAVINRIPNSSPTTSVSSAILTSAGRVFTGVNVYHFSGGPCAEHVALGNAYAGGVLNAAMPSPKEEGRLMQKVGKGEEAVGEAQEGEGETLTLCVAVKVGGKVLSPCGRCRQILLDYHPEIRVIVKTEKGLASVGLRELLPWAYEWRHDDD